MIREKVEIGEGAVDHAMGAVINIGAVIGEGTMIDMGAVLGGRAIVGNRCHIGAGTVLAGVVEPASATPVVIEDDVMIGANAVVIEGVRVGRGAVVGAGAIVIKDVPAGAVVVGNPARIIKMKDEKTEARPRSSTRCAPRLDLPRQSASRGEGGTTPLPDFLRPSSNVIECDSFSSLLGHQHDPHPNLKSATWPARCARPT
ncbi:MAG: DapH/DapD/GlmU-related protein [Sutterella wadsworthensis]